MRKEELQEIKDLLVLYHEITFGAMQIKKPWWKLLFTHQKCTEGEEYIEKIQGKVESLINKKLKKNLTFQKGIPYYMVGATEFINSILGTEE